MEKPKIFIPDASIIIAYLLQENLWSKQINKFFDDFKQEKIQCLVPPLWYYEISNRLARIKIAREKKNNILFQNENNLGFVTIEPDKEQNLCAFNLCEKYSDITFYDASYHALAQSIGGIFITADKKYFNLIKKEKNIEFIADYS